MLTRDRGRYFGLVIALAFTAFIVTQQPSTLLGIMARTTALIRDTHGVDLWVMDPNVRYIEDLKPMSDGALQRVRGVAGVQFAVPFFKGSARARLADGTFQNCELYAVDDALLVGAPPAMARGTANDLRVSDAIFLDEAGAKKLGAARRDTTAPASSDAPPPSLAIGDVIELNDSRAVVNGLFSAPPSFQSLPRVYTTWQRVRRFVPNERKMLTFILVRVNPGQQVSAVARAITERTGLLAIEPSAFSAKTTRYFLLNTGILITFGTITLVAVLIGFFIAAQTFRNFTLENIRYFGALSAMGAEFWQLLGMVVVQAVVAGTVGTGLGLGLAGLTARATAGGELAGALRVSNVLFTIGAMIVVCAIVAMISIRSVRRLEPAAVFRA